MDNIVFSSNNLSKKYNNTYVLKDVNLKITQGEVYGLVGKNGAGKTTLMKIITGLTNKTTGDFSLFGIPDNQKISRKKLGSIIEDPALYENLNAYENLKIQALLTNTYDKNKIYELLELLSLQDTKNKKVFEYSLGMKQRLGLAIALINDPKFLVLDEPINGLDPDGIMKFREFLKMITTQNKLTVLISSHILSELEKTCDTIGFIDRGLLLKEICMGTANDITNVLTIKTNQPQFACKVLEQLFQIKNIKIINDKLTIEQNFSQNDLNKILKALLVNNVDITTYSFEKTNLEDYFMQCISNNSLGASDV